MLFRLTSLLAAVLVLDRSGIHHCKHISSSQPGVGTKNGIQNCLRGTTVGPSSCSVNATKMAGSWKNAVRKSLMYIKDKHGSTWARFTAGDTFVKSRGNFLAEVSFDDGVTLPRPCICDASEEGILKGGQGEPQRGFGVSICESYPPNPPGHKQCQLGSLAVGSFSAAECPPPWSKENTPE